MAHPKSRISKSRRDKRRTHHKCESKAITICQNTGEAHLMHRAYYHEGNLYLKGKMIAEFAKQEVVEEEED